MLTAKANSIAKLVNRQAKAWRNIEALIQTKIVIDNFCVFVGFSDECVVAGRAGIHRQL